MGQSLPVTPQQVDLTSPLVMVLPASNDWLKLPAEELARVVGPRTQVIVTGRIEEPRR